MHSIFSAKKIRTTIALCALSVAIAAPAAYAWTVPDTLVRDAANLINIWNDCTMGSATNGVWGQDGDTVTTTKWNQLACQVFSLKAKLLDTGRSEQTAFEILEDTSPATGKRGYHLSDVNVGVNRSMPSAANGIFFYDLAMPNWLAPLPGAQKRPAMGRVGYDQVRDTVFVAAPKGVSIYQSNDSGLPTAREYRLGWTAINLYDTAPFDSGCLYRIYTNDGNVINMPIVNPLELRAYFDGVFEEDGPDALGPPTRIQVASDAKTQLHNPNILHSSARSWAFGSSVIKITRFCLPTYDL